MTSIASFDRLTSTPHLCLCLKRYFTIGVSIASCERSFSKLKEIESYLRSTMNDDRSMIKNLILKISSLILLQRKLKIFNFEEAIDPLFA